MNTLSNFHPSKTLPYLFFTEVWERLGFYVIQGLLVLYMTQSMGFSDQQSYTLMGVFTALGFMAPLLGGYVADHILGYRRSVILGAIFLGIGYATFAFPWDHAFYLALATIIVGNAFYKPNIIILVSEMYAANHKEQTGFGTFYLSINVGMVLAGLISGEVRNHFGWEAAFLLASASLILSMATFLLANVISRMDVQDSLTPLTVKRFLTLPWIIFYSVVIIAVLSVLLRQDFSAEWLLTIAAILLVGCFIVLGLKQACEYQKRLFALCLLVIPSIVFWTLSLQIFFCLNVFVHRSVNRDWFGYHLQTTGFYALVSVFIILLWPITQQLGKKFQMSAMSRVCACMFVLGLGYWILSVGTNHFDPITNLMNPLWIVGAYFCFAVSELMLLPIDISRNVSLVPPHLTSLAKILWFLALGFGGVFAGWIAKRSDVPSYLKSGIAEMAIYHNTFMDFMYLAFGMTIILLLCYLFTRKYLDTVMKSE